MPEEPYIRAVLASNNFVGLAGLYLLGLCAIISSVSPYFCTNRNRRAEKRLQAKVRERSYDAISGLRGIVKEETVMAQKEYANQTVSVIMPAYNSSAYIEDSIDSVLAQTYPDWELIIVDDASTDNTQQLVTAYQDERIRYYRNDTNRGVAISRNRGIELARGRYLAFLDSDDLWLPEKLTHQVAFMQKKRIGFSYHWYRQFTTSAKQPGLLVRTKACVDYAELLKGNDIGCLTVMVDHQQFPDILMPQQRHEDYIAWLNVLSGGGRAYSLPEDLARYRLGQGSLTSNKWKSLYWTWQVYRDAQQLPLVKSLYYMWHYISQGLRKHHYL